MGSRLRLAAGLGCAIVASSVYAASPFDNAPKVFQNLQISAKALKENDQVDGVAKKYSISKSKLEEALAKTRELCEKAQVENGLPGLVIAVTVNGKIVYDEGFGYADVENQVPMRRDAIMRIASISKSMTMAMMGKLMEDGKINIDLPIQTYLPNFPQKDVDGKPVTITTRHLLSHLSGIRHYKKKADKDNNNNNKAESEMELKEYFLKQKFDTIEKAMELFQNDELFHEPGTKYLYSSHAWTAVAGIIEKIVEKPFPKHSKKMFNFWGLKHTFLDEHEPLIYNRARYYTRKSDGHLENSPYVDNSYKWSGGGFLSNVQDLTQFANMLLYCYQHGDNDRLICDNGLPKKPYLKQSTIQQMWTGDTRTLQDRSPDFLYGLGFVIGEPMRNCAFCKEKDLMTVHHSGGAVGASSILALAFPKKFQFGIDTVDKNRNFNQPELSPQDEQLKQELAQGDVKGVAVAMITNLTSVGLTKTAIEIAHLYKWLL